MTTLGQDRSKYALEQVLQVGQRIDKFDTFTAGAATMILRNGLGQTMAFWMQKSEGRDDEKHGALLRIVRVWLNEKQIIQSTDNISFIRALSEVPQETYLAAQKETLALLEWVKRYASSNF
ncbi:MAG: type III-B CRISPR module-associated protein Cmr5 [Spirochaetes bacterium]|nr:type III-B CRISPR module-associated protein Cmr5 [Spirochaetota bacterium]HOM11200.1 type III-B CRISPR module-associated protein Cmr5 [Spirochaetota bacterium]